MIDLLASRLSASFGPSHLCIGLLDADTGRISVVQHLGLDQIDAMPLLELALRHGAPAWSARPADDLRDAGLPVPPHLPEVCLSAPFSAKRGMQGVAVLGGDAGRLDQAALDLVTAFAAVAGVALEGARLVEFLDDSKRSWEETVDAISLALCIVERSGRVQRANRAFAALIGVPVATLVGRAWLELVPPGWADGVSKALASSTGGHEVELRASDRTFVVSAFPITGSEGSRAVLLFDDQTERRRLQDQLIQSEKMSAIGQLIAGVAHDLNNPLTSVVGFADFLAESGDAPPRLKEPLLVIRQEAERAANLVRNLLGFARKQEHRVRSTSIRPLLHATLGLLHNQLMANRVEASLELEPDLPELDLDPNQIQQVFVNLINNASQAIASAGRPGTITIRVRHWLDGIAVDISDDGPGLTPELATRAFEPFFTTKPEGLGTGLGLSISQGIVKEHGGRITLATDPGMGATFTVELPRRSRPTPVAPPEAIRDPIRPLRVLVIDDEPHILHYMRATLEAWGHTVDVAADGFVGLERALAAEFDIIISDLRMPRLGGREFYQELQQKDSAIASRVVFSTGDTIRGDTLTFIEQQGRPCLHKPFSLSELRALLAAVSRHAGPGIAEPA